MDTQYSLQERTGTNIVDFGIYTNHINVYFYGTDYFKPNRFLELIYFTELFQLIQLITGSI